MLNKDYDIKISSFLPNEWFKEAEGATFFGRPISEYTFEELSAIAVHGWKLFQEVENKRERKIL